MIVYEMLLSLFTMESVKYTLDGNGWVASSIISLRNREQESQQTPVSKLETFECKTVINILFYLCPLTLKFDTVLSYVFVRKNFPTTFGFMCL